MRLQTFTIALGLLLATTGPALSDEDGSTLDRRAATVVPFYGIGGEVAAGPAEKLTGRVVDALRRNGGIEQVTIGGDGCELFAEIAATEGGQTTALIQTDPIDSVEQIPAAFGQLAQKLEGVLGNK